MRKGTKDRAKRFGLVRPVVLVAGTLVVLLLLVGSVVGWRLFKAETASDLTRQVRVIADIPLSGGTSRFDYHRH